MILLVQGFCLNQLNFLLRYKINLLCRLRFFVSNYVKYLISKAITLPHLNHCYTLIILYYNYTLNDFIITIN